MAPLIVMVVAWMAFRLLGAVGIFTAANSSPGALRFALAAMFASSALLDRCAVVGGTCARSGRLTRELAVLAEALVGVTDETVL